MQLEVTVPSLLRDCIGDQPRVFLEAGTLAEALQRLLEGHPLLGIHLYDEAGKLRPHVLIFYNEESIAWLERLDLPLQPGDRLTIVQNVSGG
jgi:molybdopterin synthase sulfur carrier subunit